MKLLSVDECSDWLRKRGMRLSPQGYPLVAETEVLEFPIPSETGEAVALAYMFGDMQKCTCGRGVFVIREWNIGSPGLDAIGHETVKSMLEAKLGDINSDSSLLIELDKSEATIVPPLLLQSMVFGWDAFYVPDKGEFLIFISHDEVAFVATRSLSPNEDVSIQFERLSIGTVETPYYLSQGAREDTGE